VRPLVLAWALAVAGTAWAAPAQPLDVAQARAEVAAGTVVWDLRSAGPVLPGAARVDPAALAAWRDRGDLAALSAAVSAAGVNLSARVLLVADADDAATARTAAELARVARGSVAWLQGGVAAWQAQGLPLQAAPAVRLPLPQRLVALDAEAPADALADASRRRTATFALHEPVAPLQRLAQTVAAPR
jgi:3-mercaptopyruvate sulfurtransferase SseA